MYSVMNDTAPNEKHKADFSSTPLILTVNRSLPADPPFGNWWNQHECSCLQTCTKKNLHRRDPCGTGGARCRSVMRSACTDMRTKMTQNSTV